MAQNKPLVDTNYLLKKFQGKGGWTYAEIPEVVQSKSNPFGFVKVKGFIDNHEIKQYRLMPMGNGLLFLPVKAEIRKKIKKEAGDWVHIILYPDRSKLEIPEEIVICFKYEPQNIYETFCGFKEWEQKLYLNWIYEAKKAETRANRIAKMMSRLAKKLKFNDKEEKIF